jgi:hypothetical protein
MDTNPRSAGKKLAVGWGIALIAAAVLAAYLPTLRAASEGDEVRAIGNRRELFVDRYLIESMSGTELRLNHPDDAGTVLNFDRAWEGQYSNYATVIKDGPIYRLYYDGMPIEPDGGPYEVTCYAESRDGIHWRKPDLELYGHTNIILTREKFAPAPADFTPFLDTRPGTPQTERYKALGGWFDKTRDMPEAPQGYLALASEDGIHWRKMQDQPVITLAGNYPHPYVDATQAPVFWSETELCYVAYIRTWADGGRPGDHGAGYDPLGYPKPGHIRVRSTGRLTSSDFIHWSKVQMMTYGDTPPDQLYNNNTSPYFRAPQIYIALGPRNVFDRPAITPEQAASIGVAYDQSHDVSEVIFMTSRGGTRYDRTFMEAYIRNDIGPKNWASRNSFPALNVVPTGPTEMSFYVVANYAQPTCHLQRYGLRTDRFASVHAPFRGGEFTTRPLTFTGHRLLINFSTSVTGGIRVEIEDRSGRPIPGFRLDDSIELIGNEIEKAVAWRPGAKPVPWQWRSEPDNPGRTVSSLWVGGDDIGRFSGQVIRLRFVMKESDLYALRFE